MTRTLLKTDPRAVPRFMRVALYAILLVGALASIPVIGGYSPIPVGTLLDAWIILFILVSIARGRTYPIVLLFFLVGYLLMRVVPALVAEAPMVDFLQAYRWVLYLIAFAFAVGRRWGSLVGLKRVTWLLLAMSLAKSLLTIVTFGPTARSGLLIENNFELALFSGLLIIIYRELSGRARFWTIALLAAVVVVSGSRSGAIVFAIAVVYAVSQAKGAGLLRRYFIGLSVPVIIYFVAQVFESRALVAGIDRLNFLTVFLAETRDWDILTWLFGTPPLTALSSNGCNSLAFYVNLFASTEDGSCYSVILHAFILRVVFDAGIFGLLLAVIVTFYTLKKSGASGWMTLTIAGVMVANSFSVSGLNSPYVGLVILLAITTCTPRTELRGPSVFDRSGHRGERRRSPVEPSWA
ncbi:hypothetical protein [Microbacterium aquilitoris]|uniref:Uncharacterized protein n=1 Tax=Microbacterium aquilitoris TaxID=3067307 RepID=A0ABU3GM70_9MICO|nr:MULTISPECIES: hypothetical protein [unclassified Microbacterium]MDT3331798.1 hypothetical protein [Microbacterium sp. KSW-18]MDT3346239.1 hypothetical protein [Microbacterium sp. KSW2-22]